ncbi:citryl-CoA lyase [Altererythrobacter xixiisoli]|uniref:citrate synthase (unknown stereospecificity) n=2 Tax=Croceibacterium xixiisoli TaxID=1476466 RepID=A0A6I4TNC0_9SPHN|nr:citryl-CoA lyase [Croceibacterium xixiisoli]
MRIGRQKAQSSAICTSDADSITVRGRDLTTDIIGHMDFTAYFWLLVTGQEPDEQQSFFLNAILCALAEHGLMPSVITARMTHAAAPESLQGAVAVGLLGCGDVLMGSVELAGRFYDECIADQQASGGTAEGAARRGIARLRDAGQPIPGFGHPLHTGSDPRADLLLRLAREQGVGGAHVAMLYAIRDLLPGALGRSLPINVNGPIAAIMLDLGFPPSALRGIALLARTAGLIGHLTEEQERPIGFLLSDKAAEAVSYDGPLPR